MSSKDDSNTSNTSDGENESDVDQLELLSYRQLQIIAQSFELPGTLKKPAMITMLKAKRDGNAELVHKIVDENRRYRAPKPGTPGNPGTSGTPSTSGTSGTSPSGDKKTTAAAKRKGPGRPPGKSPDNAPEKRTKRRHSLTALDQVFAKGSKSEKMSATQLHSTQPLLRALLDTTPPVEFRDGSNPVSNVQHEMNTQRNMAIINRANMMQQNQQTVSIYQATRTDNQVSSYYQRYPNNPLNDHRYHAGPGLYDNIPQQTYSPNFGASALNDNIGFPMVRNYSIPETIIPDLVDYNGQNNPTPNQPQGQAELSIMNANYTFTGNPDMSPNVSGINMEAWNRSNSLSSSVESQEHSVVRRLFTLNKRHFLAPAATSSFRDSGGFIIRNTHERERSNYFNNNENAIYYNNIHANQVHDLSLPKPGPSQPSTPRAPSQFNNNYYNLRQPSFVGSDFDLAYTQTRGNFQGHQAQMQPLYESGGQMYAPSAPAREPPPAYQSPRELRYSQQAIMMNSSNTSCAPMTPIQFNPTGNIPNCLEYLYNYRREQPTNGVSEEGGRMQCERPPSATSTTTTNCHRHPKISVRAGESHSGSEATESSPEADDPDCSEMEANGSSSNAEQVDKGGNSNMNWSVPSPLGSSHYAETRTRSLLSLPLLYQTLETEVQINEQMPAMDTSNSDYLGKLTPNASSTPMSNAQLVELTPPAQPNSQNMTPTAIMPKGHTTGRIYINEMGLVRCQYAVNGCKQIYPNQQAKYHEDGCLYMIVTCPLEYCTWKGMLGTLADHICEVAGHKHALYYGEKQGFVLDWSQQSDGSSLHFVQLCARRLFVVTVAFRAAQMYVFLQEIATYTLENLKPPNAMGYLEIAGKDGFPYSWNGQIAPVQTSLMDLMISGQCLNIHLGDIASVTGSSATLYEMVTT